MPECNNHEGLIEHHVKYKEMHGVDKTIWMTWSEHKLLHNRLRREGKCNVPVDKLHKISTAACQRTEKWKLARVKYLHTEKGRRSRKEYGKKALQWIDFYETLMKNVRLYEILTYNSLTGNISWSARFKAENGKKLYYIDIGGV